MVICNVPESESTWLCRFRLIPDQWLCESRARILDARIPTRASEHRALVTEQHHFFMVDAGTNATRSTTSKLQPKGHVTTCAKVVASMRSTTQYLHSAAATKLFPTVFPKVQEYDWYCPPAHGMNLHGNGGSHRHNGGWLASDQAYLPIFGGKQFLFDREDAPIAGKIKRQPGNHRRVVTQTGSPGRQRPQSTMRARGEAAWPSPTSLFWSWRHSRVRGASTSISASNPSCRKLRPGSLSCRSVAGRACAPLELPVAYPKDPADRIIGATALVEGLSLLTADREIRRSKALRTIW